MKNYPLLLLITTLVAACSLTSTNNHDERIFAPQAEEYISPLGRRYLVVNEAGEQHLYLREIHPRPTGKGLAIAQQTPKGWQLLYYRTTRKPPQWVANLKGWDTQCHWSPDGNWILVAEQKTDTQQTYRLFHIEESTLQEHPTFYKWTQELPKAQQNQRTETLLGWSPDSKTVYISITTAPHTEATTHRIHIKTGHLIQ